MRKLLFLLLFIPGLAFGQAETRGGANASSWAGFIGPQITSTNTLTSGSTGAGFTIALGASTITGTLTGTNGGTGINNGSSTITIGGNVAFSGAHTFTGTLTGNTSVTFPTSGTLVPNPFSATGDIVYGGTGGAWTALSGQTTTTKEYLSQTGTGTASAAPVWAQVAFSDLSGTASAAQLPSGWNPVTPANGGTGVASPTAHYVAVAEGSSNFAFVSPTTNTGYVLTSNGTGSDPSFQALPGGGLTYSEITTSATATMGSQYVCNSASLVTVTLPATAAAGSMLQIVGKGAGGWKIAQASGQTIHWGGAATTTGATGYVSSLHQYDAIEIVCTTANTDFVVIAAPDALTVN